MILDREIDERELEALDAILDACLIFKSNLPPSLWYEKNMVFPQGTAFPGPARYSLTPYWKEPVDCADPNDPTRDITIMGPAQQGKSAMVLNPIVGYTISENPGNILFLTGHSELTKKAMVKIDLMIKSCSIDKLIMPSVIKKRNNRTGDTAMEKEFRGGTLIAGAITNHNLMRQNDIMVSIADDLDAGQLQKAATGNTVDLVKGRTKAYAHKCKRYWVSSPQIKGKSLIESQFLLSDQRYYYTPCECCGALITMKLKIPIDEKNTAGLYWKVDNFDRVIPSSVGYICQECGGFFTDKNKNTWLHEGKWQPTVEHPKQQYHRGYHMSGLLAPHGMTSWFYLAETHQICCPTDEPIKKDKYQTFLNIDVGDLYEEIAEDIQASTLVSNCGRYLPGVIPNKISIDDGNGNIVLVTCAVDMNGKVEDARLDYEIVGWSESGSSYSILHGSIGTFVSGERNLKNVADRKRWTYEAGKPNSVWPELDKVLKTVFITDDGTRKMKIAITGLDTGHFTREFAYPYIEKSNHFIVALKGDSKANTYLKYVADVPNFKPSQERKYLYLVEVNKIKDDISTMINLKYDENNDEKQPSGYMNFPKQTENHYQIKNYFSHYEAESRKVEEKDGVAKGFKWEKKTSNSQNHFFDCRVYNIATKDIFVYMIFKEMKKPEAASWTNFVSLMLNTK